MKAIIPTGGMGTRMRPLTFSANKHLIPVANKPLILYPVETIAATGIKDIALTYNPGQLDIMKSFLGDGSQWGVNFTYILQENPRGGLSNIFQVCEEFIDGDSFCMHLGDNIFTEGIKNLADHFRTHKPKGLVGLVHHPENVRMGVPYFDEKGKLVKYVEKPENPPHDFAIPGIYFFDPIIFECFKGKDKIVPSSRGELEISAAYQWLIDHKHVVDTLEIKGMWLDPGKVQDWLEANSYLLDLNTKTHTESKLDSSVKVVGRVTVGKNCVITNSRLKGPLNIGDNVNITNSTVGPFTSVYNNCIIIDSTITDSVLMESVVIDKVSKNIENSIIGPNSNISQSERSEHYSELLVGELSKILI
jgi:glucose-1-phosphate thymidylyltransferase